MCRRRGSQGGSHGWIVPLERFQPSKALRLGFFFIYARSLGMILTLSVLFSSFIESWVMPQRAQQPSAFLYFLKIFFFNKLLKSCILNWAHRHTDTQTHRHTDQTKCSTCNKINLFGPLVSGDLHGNSTAAEVEIDWQGWLRSPAQTGPLPHCLSVLILPRRERSLLESSAIVSSRPFRLLFVHLANSIRA